MGKDDCISRSLAVDEAKKYIMTSGVSHQSTWNECVNTIVETLQGLPPADGFHSRQNTGLWFWWTDDRADYYKCSECGYGEEGEVKFGEETNFCPCCGAEMTVPGSVKNGRVPVTFCE